MPLSPQPPKSHVRGGEVDDGIVDTAAAKLTFCGHFLYIFFLLLKDRGRADIPWN